MTSVIEKGGQPQNVREKNFSRLSSVIYTINGFPEEWLGTWSPREVTDFANNAQAVIARIISPKDKEIKVQRRVDERKVIEITEAIKNGAVIFMRHGKQDTKLKVNSPIALKIIQMRHDHNMYDPVADASLPEAVATGLVLQHAKENTSHDRVFYDDDEFFASTSANARSAQAATTIAYSISRYPPKNLIVDPRLNCVNYRTYIPTEEFKKYLINGSLPWIQENVDHICGTGTYKKVEKDIDSLLSDLSARSSNLLRIFVTHTQQLDYLMKKAGITPRRVSEYGMVLVFPDGKTEVMDTGIFFN